MRDVIELRSGSFVSQLSAIKEKISQYQQLDLVLARPRGERTLLQHLRLPTKFDDGELPQHLETSARILLTDEGFEEAFVRLAALPVSLPRAVRDAFVNLPDIEREELRKRATQNTSPFLRFHAATLFLHGNETDQSSATEMLIGIAAEENRPQWELFQRMLVWAESCLIVDCESNRSSSAPLLASAWIHAARLHQTFPSGNVPESVTTYFRSNNFSPAVAAFDSQTVSRHDIASPLGFDRTRLLLCGLSHQISGLVLKEELREKLQAALSTIAFPGDSNGLPSFSLLELRSTAPNRLGSFLADCDNTALSSVLRMENANRFSDATIEGEATEYVNQLANESQKIETWTCLAAYLKRQPPMTAQREPFCSALTALSFKSLPSPTLDQLQLVAMFVFGQAVHFSAVGASIWEAKLSGLAEVLADPVRRFPITESALLLGNCAFLLSHAAPVETEAARRFSEVAGDIAAKWPAAADSILQATVRVLLRQPSDVHAQAWRGVTQLRCSAGRLRPMKQLEKDKGAVAEASA
jgi:hypothetical protein